MTEEFVHEQLLQLRDLIAQERRAARDFDMEALSETARRKEELMEILAEAPPCESLECRELAEEVRAENRRNAFLFWSGLHLVRDTVAFFEKQIPPPAYGASGSLTPGKGGGKLLAGRI
jgi:hypothetical protein